VLGGAATYFSLSASFFIDVRVVAVVGEDFTAEDEAVLVRRSVDVSGIKRERGKSFFWAGEYGENVNEAKTLVTELNVFERFNPVIPKQYADSDFLFLANIHPTLQKHVRDQMPKALLTGGDTMNYWITSTPKELGETLRGVDVLLINDTEARMLAKINSLPRAAQKILTMGPRVLVIKHGEYGATAFFREAGLHPFRAPAMPIEEVVDPTGAGDSFAGGFMGYLASQGELNREVFKRAMFYGGVMGSFACETFGTERLQSLTRGEIDARFQLFRELSHLD
jgi:sugar/nucleoside kinase (ribokinase family)